MAVYDAAGRSAIQEFTVNVSANCAASAAKPAVSARASGSSEIFSWNRVDGATGYTLKYWTSGNEADATTVDCHDIFGYSYPLPGGAGMSGLNFTVTPYNGAGEGVTSDAAAPAASALTLAVSPAVGALNLNWNALSGASYYIASYSAAGDQNTQTTGTLSGTSSVLSGLEENAGYSVYLTAFMPNGSLVRSNTAAATTATRTPPRFWRKRMP